MKISFLIAALVAGFLAACRAPDPVPAPTPPLPSDLANLDPAIAERMEKKAELVRQTPRDAGRWQELGRIYQAHYQFELAARCYKQSLALDKNDPKVYFYQAQVERRLGELDESVEHMRRAGELEPTYAPAHWQLALWLLKNGQLEAARLAVDRALALDATDRATVLTSARVHIQTGAAEKAAELLERHLDKYSSDRYAHFLLGSAYRRLGRGDDARRHLELGQGSEPDLRDPW